MSPHDGGNAALDFPYGAPPSPGTVAAVAPGIKWLRMPLPFALDHINLWLVADGDGWAIVDSGLANDATKELWRHILATHLDGKRVTRVIVTHFHPDHMGLAGWLTETIGVDLWATETEWLQARLASLDDRPALDADAQAFYERIGAKRGIALASNNLGDLCWRGGEANWEQARGYWQRAQRLYDEIGDQRGLAIALLNLGEAQVRLGMLTPAEPLLRQARTLADELEDDEIRGFVDHALARLWAASQLGVQPPGRPAA